MTKSKLADRVMGNRHVGGCCAHENHMGAKPRPYSPPKRKKKAKKSNLDISPPSKKYERALREEEQDMANYRALVEARYT